MKRIAVVGFTNSGKDEVCKYLRNKYNFTQIAFGDRLKVMLANIYNMPIENFYQRDLKEIPNRYLNGRTPRQAMEFMNKFKQIDPYTWVYPVVEAIRLVEEHPIVISDLRYHQEWKYLKSMGFKIVYVDRTISNKFNFIDYIKRWTTEANIISLRREASFFIDNNQDLEHLHSQLDSLIS